MSFSHVFFLKKINDWLLVFPVVDYPPVEIETSGGSVFANSRKFLELIIRSCIHRACSRICARPEMKWSSITIGRLRMPEIHVSRLWTGIYFSVRRNLIRLKSPPMSYIILSSSPVFSRRHFPHHCPLCELSNVHGKRLSGDKANVPGTWHGLTFHCGKWSESR